MKIIEGIATLWPIAFWRFHQPSPFYTNTLPTKVCEFGSKGATWQNRRNNRLSLSFVTPSKAFILCVILIVMGSLCSAAEPTTTQKELMQKCIQYAYQAKARNNYPFAAMLVKDGKVILIAENAVKKNCDATAHSVLNLITQASRKMGQHDLRYCTIYCSTEPCPMCAAAIYWAGIPRLIYGCPVEVLQKKTGEGFFIPCREFLSKGKRKVEIIGPVLEEYAAYAHEDFWNQSQDKE